ncbi:MAG: DUF2752 domain-containing protein [Muribaculaceae bacterium]|nr:DUF2752 domain-containing protein [Muribaculaceae bacterium]
MNLTKEHNHKIVITIILAIIVITAFTVYFAFDPVADGKFFPKCPVWLLTGLSCPSCGNQRAFHALLNGEFSQAVRFNYFLLFGIPFFALLIIAILFRRKLPRLYGFMCSRYGAYIYLTFYIIWFILRNILHI